MLSKLHNTNRCDIVIHKSRDVTGKSQNRAIMTDHPAPLIIAAQTSLTQRHIQGVPTRCHVLIVEVATLPPNQTD